MRNGGSATFWGTRKPRYFVPAYKERTVFCDDSIRITVDTSGQWKVVRRETFETLIKCKDVNEVVRRCGFIDQKKTRDLFLSYVQ